MLRRSAAGQPNRTATLFQFRAFRNTLPPEQMHWAKATANNERIACSVSQVGAPAERGGASGSSCGLPSQQANNQASQKARK